ncbi:uncharacterized protein [Haliotis asinina]|uniref:uncharacterized protein n=1 Tax=Haliotis asinina TaxID=109174 RepID=UPI0035327BE8
MNASTLIVIFCAYMITPGSSEECTKINSCSCKNSKGTIDLKALGKNDGTAKYPDQADGTGTWYYSYNPCNDFSEGSGCTNVAACQTDQLTNYFSLGDQTSAKFKDDPTNGLQIEYSATTDTKRTSYVTLKCDENTESSFTVDGENPPGSALYYFTLTSKHCCPNAGPGPKPGDTGGGGLSAGSIVVIIFFALAFLYILGGLGFQTFVRKASGREMVPNYNLWSALPGLIRDGFILTFTCGRRSGYGKV